MGANGDIGEWHLVSDTRAAIGRPCVVRGGEHPLGDTMTRNSFQVLEGDSNDSTFGEIETTLDSKLDSDDAKKANKKIKKQKKKGKRHSNGEVFDGSTAMDTTCPSGQGITDDMGDEDSGWGSDSNSQTNVSENECPGSIFGQTQNYGIDEDNTSDDADCDSDKGMVGRQQDVIGPQRYRNRAGRRSRCKYGTAKEFETVNVTSGKPMLRYLKHAASQFYAVQEHHVPSAGLTGMAVKLKKLGYKFCATPATSTGNSDTGTSGGAAIVVRDCYAVTSIYGAKALAPWTIVPGRAAGARIHGLIKGGVLVLSVYLKSGEPPTSALNWATLVKVAEAVNTARLPFIIGGDWQCTPAELRASKWLDMIAGNMVASTEATCVTDRSAREIDYFIVSAGLDSVCTKPEALQDTDIATHMPVRSSILGNPRALTIRSFDMPKHFPRRAPYGPVRRIPAWPPFAPTAECSSTERTAELAAYWMKHAEEELCLQFDLVDDEGAPLSQFVGRAAQPKVVDRRPVPRPTVGDMLSDVRGTFWNSILHRVTEIQRWFDSYYNDDGGLWLRQGFTRHCIAAAIKLVRRVTTPPKSLERLDPDLLVVWRTRANSIVQTMQGILVGYDIYGTEILGYWNGELREHIEGLQKVLASARSQEFGQWIDDQLASGAGGIHAATKEGVGGHPDPISELEPGIHAAQAIVESEILKWAQPTIWRAWPTAEESDADFTARAWFVRQDEFPDIRGPPPPDEIRTSSGTFPWRTSIGADGLHPRSIGLLSNRALQYLGMLQMSSEALGAVPELFRIVALFTRMKKNGSYRTVGNLPTYYRVYARTRLKVVRKWERDNPCDLFWAAKGKGSDTAVHTASTAAGIALSKGLKSAAALVDVFKCYEVLEHNIIVTKCRLVNFPLDILAVALSMYSAARYLIYDGAMAGPVFTHRGITAGCTFATFILRGAMQFDMIQYNTVVCIPRQLIFQIFVDDLMVMGSSTDDKVVVNTAYATSRLIEVLDDLKMPAALDKRIIVASPKIGQKILQCGWLKDKHFKHQVVAEQLGVDFAPGRKAGNAARDKRAKIFGNRLPKIRAFTRKRAGVGRRLAATAGVPSIGHAAKVLGTSGTRLSWHQTLMHRTINATNTNRSRFLNLTVAGSQVEPAYGANSAPILAWARMLHQELFPLKDLRGAMQFYQRKLAPLHSKWAQVTGTITALLATLDRLGWTIIGAHLLKSHLGTYHDLRLTPWAALKTMIDKRTNEWLWSKHTSGTPMHDMFSKGASTKIVQSLLVDSGLDKECKQGLTSAATGGQWTQTRHVKADHDVYDLCLLCLAAPGTEWHRVYDCPCTEHLRTVRLDLGVQRRAQPHEASHHERWTRGHLPHSAYPTPPSSRLGTGACGGRTLKAHSLAKPF